MKGEMHHFCRNGILDCFNKAIQVAKQTTEHINSFKQAKMKLLL